MAKMIKFTNGYGCIMEFEGDIKDLEQIKDRLGTGWKIEDTNNQNKSIGEQK